jgi:MYXO-CTERM domain-containing protein
MRQILLVVIGVAAAVAGAVWTLQGLGYVGGSFMSGATVWAVIGPVVALAGLVLVAAGSRRRRRKA